MVGCLKKWCETEDPAGSAYVFKKKIAEKKIRGTS
jgi:hypothetical protein